MNIDNVIENIESENNSIDDILEIYNESEIQDIFNIDESKKSIKSNIDNEEWELSLKRDDIPEGKPFFKFIKDCERLIRMSPEYKDWVDFVRSSIGINYCQITGEYHADTKSDIHHHPCSLFSITKAITKELIDKQKPFTSLDVSMKVLELHYDMKVGFISIIKSLHEKFHNGALSIPMELIKHGDFNDFIKNYSQYLDEEDLEIIHNRLKINKKNCGWSDGYKWIIDKN